MFISVHINLVFNHTFLNSLRFSVSIMSTEEGERIQSADFNSLPSEILTRIFKLLPLRDRKIVRLVSLLWYDSCSRLSITKNEKFVFRTGYSIQEIVKVLVKPNFVQMSLEFQGLPIDTFPVYTWKACGERIYSLDFHNCRLNDKTVKNIILYCVNLTSFQMQVSFCAAGHNLGGIFCSPRLLDALIQKNVKRTKLQTFAIFVDDVHLPSSILKKIFHIYPCIKHFSTGAPSYDDMFFICLVLHAGKEPVFSRLDTCLRSSVLLESLAFNIPSDGNWIKMCLSTPKLDLRLKKLETMLIYKDSMKEALLQFFNSQKYLEVLKLTLVESSEEFVKTLTFHVLRSCPNLRELRLNFKPHSLIMSDSEFAQFLSLISKLQFLSLSFNTLHTSSNELSSSTVLGLNALRLEHYAMDEKLCSTFLKRCSLLKHLELSAMSDGMLQDLFKNLLDLETLILYDIESCTDYGFTGQDSSNANQSSVPTYSIKRLQKLEHLEINGICGDEFTKKTIRELQFPNLKYLSLCVGLYSTFSEKMMIRLALNLPALETLAVDEFEDSLKNTTELCRHLKNLYRLICADADLENLYIDDDCKIRCLFDVCPSLRYISDVNSNVFSLNPFTKKILLKSSVSFKFKENIFTGEVSQNDVIYLL